MGLVYVMGSVYFCLQWLYALENMNTVRYRSNQNRFIIIIIDNLVLNEKMGTSGETRVQVKISNAGYVR